MKNQQDSNIDFFELFNNSVFMKTLFLLIIHFVVLIFKLLKPSGLKTVAAENLAIRQQLMIATRKRHRSPSLTPLERFLFGLWAMLIPKHRIKKVYYQARDYS